MVQMLGMLLGGLLTSFVFVFVVVVVVYLAALKRWLLKTASQRGDGVTNFV